MRTAPTPADGATSPGGSREADRSPEDIQFSLDRPLQLLSRMEDHEQDDEPVSPQVALPVPLCGAILGFGGALADLISGVKRDLPRPAVQALGTRSARPVRRQAVNSRRERHAPRHIDW